MNWWQWTLAVLYAVSVLWFTGFYFRQMVDRWPGEMCSNFAAGALAGSIWPVVLLMQLGSLTAARRMKERQATDQAESEE